MLQQIVTSIVLSSWTLTLKKNINRSKTFLPHQEQRVFFPPVCDRKWRFYILFSFLVLLLVMSRFAPAIPLASWQVNTKSMLLWLMRSASLISIRETPKLNWVGFGETALMFCQPRGGVLFGCIWGNPEHQNSHLLCNMLLQSCRVGQSFKVWLRHGFSCKMKYRNRQGEVAAQTVL